ncbi:MAG TPA: carboxypeptidase-like regulatory domain-containing protein [Vicinamibacterales bacterium]|nr:carboxypeptidase-like regulatory domain-containing protein [Vicinamibacterales bacterium]
MRAQVVVQIVLAMAIGHAVAVGQSSPPRDSRAPAPSAGASRTPRESVPPFIARGRVVTADGMTLRRVRVSVQGGERSAPTFTGEDGRFELIVPAADGGGLRFTKPGFVPASIGRQAAQAAGDLTITLVKGAAINGSVVDQAGAAAVGVQVRVRRIDGTVPGGSQIATDTDDLGAFRVGNLPAGRYAISTGMADGRRGRGAPAAGDGRGSQGRGRAQGGRAGRGDQQGLAPETPTVDVATGQEVSAVVVYEDVTSAQPRSATLSQPASRDAQTVSSSIRGRVLNHDATPVPGASVQLVPDSGNGARRSTITDASGQYEISGLAPGRYRARVSKSGLQNVEYGQSRALQSGRVIDLGRNQRLQGIDITMPRGSVVTGTVVDASGEPVEGASVQVWQARFTGGRTSVAPAASVRARRTDDRGRYRLYGLLPGTYYVVASESDTRGGRFFFPGTPSLASANTIQADSGLETAGIDITLSPGRPTVVRGLARRASGQPARGRATLAVSHRSGAPALPLQTAALDSEGGFEFRNVSPGEYVVQVVDGGPSRGQSGGATPRDGGGAGNSGRGGGPAGVGASRGRGGQQAGSAGTRGGGGGGVRSRGTGPGTASSSGTQTADREFGAQFVTAVEGEVATVAIDTLPGVRMTGRIVLDGDASNVQPSSFGFSAYPADPDLSPLQDVRTLRAAIQEDGTFEITDLIGALRFGPTRMPDGWWLESVNVNGVNAVEDPAVFGKSALSGTNVMVVFADGAGTVEGRVLNDRRQPATEFNVVVFAASADRWFSQSPYVKFGSPSQDGTFSVTGVPPGEYLVAAVDRIDGGTDYGDWQDPAVLTSLARAARRVNVATGQRVTVDLRLLSLSR